MLATRLGALLLLVLSVGAQEISQSGLEIKAERPMLGEPARARHAMVATSNEIASRAGLDVLRRGGNAVDAAVAVAFALAVVHPEAGNLGGGGYMIVRMADGRTKAIDYRETAPAAARPGMFRYPREARVGYLASAVPGTVAGMAEAHMMFGTKPWRALLEPARRLAARGFPASLRMARILPLQAPVMRPFPETAKVFLHGGSRPLVEGEIVREPDLAATIGRIARRGWREFYEGETARRIAADMKKHGGAITLADLENYKPVIHDPLRGTYRGYIILTMPPSSSGGMALIEMLNILERFELRLGMEGSAESCHLEVEAMRRAYRDRLLYASDPAFEPVPVARLTSKEYAAELAREILPDRATPSSGLGPASSRILPRKESPETTHFSIIDRDGNIVSNTYTLNGFYGSQVIPKGTGVLMNDIMSAFSRAWARNGMAPGRRPVSSMSPCIVLHADGAPWFALGSPGASTIPNTVLQVIVNIIDYKMALRDAIVFPRIHHPYLPDRIDAEPGAIALEVAGKLRGEGYRINPKLRSQGDVQAVMIENPDGWRLGWSDGRRGGRALGN